jgi:hypothetical protein
MRTVAGAILILAGSVLVAAGMIADAVTRGEGNHLVAGCVLGAVVGLVGIAVFVSGTLKRAWDAIPVDEKKPGQPV